MWILDHRPSSAASLLAVLLASAACGGDATGAPSRLDGVWTTALANDTGPDSVRVVISQYSDYLQGYAVFASGRSQIYSVLGSFIGTDVELDFLRVPVFSPDQPPELLVRASYRNGRISGQLTRGDSNGPIALVPWKPNVTGIPGTYAFVSPGVHDTLVFAAAGQLERARHTPSFSYWGLDGIYERKASSIVIRYRASPFDNSFPLRDSLVIRGSTLVRPGPTTSGPVEEVYQRVP